MKTNYEYYFGSAEKTAETLFGKTHNEFDKKSSEWVNENPLIAATNNKTKTLCIFLGNEYV